MKNNVNESNTILLATARELLSQAANSTKYPGLTQFLTEIEARSKQVVLSPDELALSEVTTDRQAAEEQLDSIVDAVKGIAYIHNKELLQAEWLKSGSKKHKEFFELFFTELAKAAELIRSELTTVKSGAYANYQATYAKWQELIAKEGQKAVTVEKINEAIDIRAGLIGLCRMLGMTGFDIEKRISK